MLMNRFERELESPQAMLIQLWNGEQPYTLKDAVAADAFGQVLTKRYLKSIRERPRYGLFRKRRRIAQLRCAQHLLAPSLRPPSLPKSATPCSCS